MLVFVLITAVVLGSGIRDHQAVLSDLVAYFRGFVVHFFYLFIAATHRPGAAKPYFDIFRR